MDEASAKLIAEKGVWLSTQPFLDLSGAAALGPAEQDKMRQVVAGTNRVYVLAKKYNIKTAFMSGDLDAISGTAEEARVLSQVSSQFGRPSAA